MLLPRELRRAFSSFGQMAQRPQRQNARLFSGKLKVTFHRRDAAMTQKAAAKSPLKFRAVSAPQRRNFFSALTKDLPDTTPTSCKFLIFIRFEIIYWKLFLIEKNYSMKISKFKPFCLTFLFVFAVLFSNQVSAQEKVLGEITITGTGTENFVTVNGERVISGRTIMSPADISTSSQASARINLPNTGNVIISPNSTLKLFFVNGGISGDLVSGEATFGTLKGAMLSILTKDGTLTVPDVDQANVVKLTVKNGTSRVNTLVGKATFNTVEINAGEYFPAQNGGGVAPTKTTATSGGGGFGSGYLLITLIAAAAAAAVIGLAASGGGNDNSTPVSPVR